MSPRPIRRLPALAAGLLAFALLAAAAAPATAATAAPVHRQQPVGRQDATVEGVVIHGDGSPAAGVAVSVVGYDSAGLAGVVATLFTLGLACIAEHDLCLTDSTEGGATTTGADGRYSDSLPDSYVAGTETDTDWVVTAGLPARGNQVVGPRSSFEFEVNIQLQAAPPLPLWEATPSVSVDGWEATAAIDGDPPPGTARPAITLGGIATPGTTATVDLRLLESEGTAAAENLVAYATAYADVRVPHANGRTIYHQAVSTGAVAVPAPHLVPPSRGAPCTTVMAEGSPASEGGDLCPVTDGSRSFLPSGATSVTVALASPVDVSAVFVAGAPDGTTVEVSGDGSSWSVLPVDSERGRSGPTGSFSTPVAIASPDAPTSARFVRVSRPEGLSGVTEVSVWSGTTTRATPPAPSGSTPGAPDGRGDAQAAGGSSAPPAASATGAGRRAGTLIGALIVLCLVGAAVGGVGWTRRRRPA